MQLIIASFCLILAFSSAIVQADPQDSEIRYIHSVQAQMKAVPEMGSETVQTLQRGESYHVTDRKNDWTELDGKGWVSEMFLSKDEPIGEAELIDQGKEDLKKASRRRSSSYSTSASARGLNAESRMRHGDESYRADFLNLDKVEDYEPSKEELEAFKNSAKLDQDD